MLFKELGTVDNLVIVDSLRFTDEGIEIQLHFESLEFVKTDEGNIEPKEVETQEVRNQVGKLVSQDELEWDVDAVSPNDWILRHNIE